MSCLWCRSQLATSLASRLGPGPHPVSSLRLPGSLVSSDCSGSGRAPGTLRQPLLVSVTSSTSATPGTGSSGPKATLR